MNYFFPLRHPGFIVFTSILTCVFTFGANAQTVASFVPPEYDLVFSDEFESDQLDRTQWCTRYVYGGGQTPQMPDRECQRNGNGSLDRLNDEKQRYVDINQLGEKLHEVKDGVLTLIATGTGSSEAIPFQSAMIRSKKTFLPDVTKSVYVTARVRLPNVRGTWPAFWVNPGPDTAGKLKWPPEIDIFDSPLNEKEDRENMLHVGAVPSEKQKTIIFTDSKFDRKWGNYVAPYSLRERWMETGIEWTEDSVCYFLDGVKIMCESYEWRQRDGTKAPPGHILFNLAIGGAWAGRHGIDLSRFPARFSIDYVRIYEKRLLR